MQLDTEKYPMLMIAKSEDEEDLWAIFALHPDDVENAKMLKTYSSEEEARKDFDIMIESYQKQNAGMQLQ